MGLEYPQPSDSSPDLQVDVEAVLGSFVQLLKRCFAARLVSVALYGSIVFGDLAPGYGDLDFLAVVDSDLSELDRQRLVELRKPLRSGTASVLKQMIEGAFLPRRMLDPSIAGGAFWWGTSGERPWSTNNLGPLVLHVIRERGRVIYGQDIRNEIPAITRQQMLEDVRNACRSAQLRGRGGTLHSIGWLLEIARHLLWIREDRLSSKSEAADWGVVHARGSWRELLPRAKQLRLQPGLADLPQWKSWLGTLDAPIKQAAAELQEACDGYS